MAMSAEYPEPGSRQAFPIQGGPYFVPGLDQSLYDQPSLDANVGEVQYEDPSEDELSEGDIDDAVANVDLKSMTLANKSDDDTDFDINLDGTQDNDDDPMSDSSGADLDVPARGSTRGRGRGRGRGRPRGRSGRGHGRGTRAGTVDTANGDDDIIGSRKRIMRRGAPRGEGRGPGRKGRRGPQVAEASPEFRALQKKALAAMIDQDFEECAQYCIDAIELNPEIFIAHSLLSEAYINLGRKEDAIEVLFNGAITRRESLAWWEVAQAIKNWMPDSEAKERDKRLVSTYTNILKLDPQDNEARLERVVAKLRLGESKVSSDCEKILMSQPFSLKVLRVYAEAALRFNFTAKARPAWEKAIPHFIATQNGSGPDGFDFQDLNTFLEILRRLEDWTPGLRDAKRLSRWLLGRKDDEVWVNFDEDDREWDEEHEPRRMQMPGFDPGKYKSECYGQELHADIRAKMGIFRLKMGPENLNEALHHFEPFDEHHLPEENRADFADLTRDIFENLWEHGHYADALRFFGSLNGWATISGYTWHQAGVCAAAVGDETNAIIWEERHLAVNVMDTETRLRVAASLLRRDEEERARSHVDAAIRNESIWTMRSKEVSDEDAKILIRHLESRPGAQPALSSLEVQESDTANGESSATSNQIKLPPPPIRQQLTRMFDRAIGRPRQSRPSISAFETGTRATAPTPEGTRDKSRTGSNAARSNGQVELMPATPSQGAGDQSHSSPRKSTSNRPKYIRKADRTLETLQEAEARIESLHEELLTVEREQPGSDTDVLRHPDWTTIGQQLFAEFSEQKSLFPYEKITPFLGFSASDRLKAKDTRTRTKDFLIPLSSYLMQDHDGIEDQPAAYRKIFANTPTSFGTIPFPRWFDILTQTALNLASVHHSKESYTILDKLLWCPTFIHYKTTEYTLNLALLACATALGDNARQNDLIRYFVNERAPDPDVYRLYQLVNRTATSPVHFYSTGPQQKFFLRIIKHHDHMAMSAAARKDQPPTQQPNRFNTATMRGSPQSPFPARDEDDQGTDLSCLDSQLLVAYGNMINANGSHQVNALNYYVRAHSVQADNPLALLSGAVAYAAMSMKRLSVNRQHQLLSSVAMLMRYKEVRLQDEDGREMKRGRLRRQREMEVGFNEGRLWAYFGLNHLAVECFWVVLELGKPKHEGDGGVGEGNDEGVLWDEPDYVMEAAFALQTIYIHSGNDEGARALGEKYLVF